MTKRDIEILEYIKSFMKKNGFTPTVREIGEGVGLYSTSTVHAHLQKLVVAGEIIPIKGNCARYKVKGMEYRDVSE